MQHQVHRRCRLPGTPALELPANGRGCAGLVVVSFSVADVARMCCGRVSALWLACVRQHEHLVSVAVYVIAGFAFFDRGRAAR